MKTTTSKFRNEKKQNGFRELFENELRDIYWAEKALTKAIPKMIKNATSQELIDALTDHLEVTKGHVERCEKAFELLGEAATGKKCEAMAGLTKEAEEIMESAKEAMVRDAGIISAAQKVEHYEISTYGGLAQLAETLGLNEIKELLGSTLEEEKQTDEKLSVIAESSVNYEAAEESETA